MPIAGIYGSDDFHKPAGRPAAPRHHDAIARAQALPMPSLQWTPEVERATAHLYERVKKVISPVEWPFMVRVINYRWDFDGHRTAYTQMVGNPVNWALAFIAIVGAAVLIALRKNRGDTGLEGEDYNRLEAVFAMYMVFWVLHIYLGTQRVMYIYHYFIGLALSFFLVPLVFKIVARKWPLLDKNRFGVLCGLTILIALSFLWIAPLTFHQYLTRQECEAKNIPITLVICQPIKKDTSSAPASTSPSSSTLLSSPKP